jgi:tRNA (guanine37-N1)-methyltransferase
MRPEPIYNALKEIDQNDQTLKILLSAKGKTYNQNMAIDLSNKEHLIFICGHYEGVDERVRHHMIDLEISVGNYVLSGGEIPAMAVTDSISRLLPGVLEKEGASEEESFSPGLKQLAEEINGETIDHLQSIEYPHYTRPAEFKGWKVPEILLSGNHKKIAEWRASKITDKLDNND